MYRARNEPYRTQNEPYRSQSEPHRLKRTKLKRAADVVTLFWFTNVDAVIMDLSLSLIIHFYNRIQLKQDNNI